MTPTDLIRLLVGFVLIANTMSVGFQVTISEVRQSLRSPGRIALWVLANFVLFPLVTVVVLHVFQATPIISAGFLVLAVCSGSPIAPRLTAMARGDAADAVAQMFFLGALSAALSPLLLTLGLPFLLPAGTLVQIDVPAILRALIVLQVLPLAAGLILRSRYPRLTMRLEQPLRIVGSSVLLCVLVLVIARESEHLALIRARGWLGMALLLALSIGIGWVSGGPRPEGRSTLALTTASRNSPVALVIAAQSFSGTPAMTAVVAYSLVSLVGALGCALLFRKFSTPRNSVAVSNTDFQHQLN